MALTDEALVECFLQGNKEAFATIVERYEQKVYGLAYRLTGDYDDAADLAQDAFIKVYRNLGQFRGQAAFSTWLYRVVTNVFLDEMRKRKRRPVVAISLDDSIVTEEGELSRELPSHDLGPEDLSAQHELQQTVRAGMQKLPEDYRVVLILRDLQGYTYDEIASMLDINLGTVKSRISRARLALRKVLEEREQHGADWRLTD